MVLLMSSEGLLEGTWKSEEQGGWIETHLNRTQAGVGNY